MSEKYFALAHQNTKLYLSLVAVELFVAALCILAGLPLLLAPGLAGGAVESILPTWFYFLWGSSLVLGGGLFGIGKLLRRIQIERAGCSLLAGFVTAYATTLIFHGLISVPAIVLQFSFVGAMIARYWATGVLLKEAKKLDIPEVKEDGP